ncbi:hypothetical protein MNBD_ALPHA01-1398 [hydrothermal vent metagenome]|uniref:DUF1838 domain-containing protein n=1 Tax=hydrothermal vent metagenome TaxID=652676 RepID=A0A3B0SDQ3_9ZZZZ
MKNVSITKLIVMTAFGAGLAGEALSAERIDLSTPQGAIQASRKVHCSLKDNEPVYYTWQGEVFSQRMGEPDRKLFRVSGMNVRQCVTIDGGPRGTGYRLVSREIMLYLDPETGKPLDRWQNPMNGRSVKVFYVENDPVNGRPTFPLAKDGSPSFNWTGRQDSGSWFMSITFPLFYHNVLQGDYQHYVGGVYQATEMFNFMGEMADLTDGTKDTAQVKVGWVRISQWLPWMEMQGREGRLYTHASGKKVTGFDALPGVLKNYITTRAPKYKMPPAGDDRRQNETSWTYFKKKVSGAKLPFGGRK